MSDSAVRAISDRLLVDSADAERATVPASRYALDLDVSSFESHDRVARYVALFTGEGRERFAARLQRGTRFDPMIRTRLRAAGLPEDLTYLALVESGYDPNAVSRASAVGMWQIMAGTARDLDLRVDWWVDERRDPVKATDAAVRNLRWLRKEFGSLFLAAAAYNGGPGRVGRGLAQLAALSDSSVGETRFFALSDAGMLKPETVNYVPQIIAAALVASEPARYGIAVEPLAPFTYDSAFVKALTPLAAVATAAHATRDELLDLNPQLLRGMTPPGAPTLVRLPAGAGPAFAARLAEVAPAERRAFRGVATKSTETLDRLAAREKVPVSALRRFNPRIAVVKKGKRKGNLVPGQVLRVPSADVLAYARPIGDVDGDGPTALPVPAVAAAAVSGPHASEDGGDVDGEAVKPPRRPAGAEGKTASKPGATPDAKADAKADAKGASRGDDQPVAKSSARRGSKSSAKASTKSGSRTAARSGAKSGSRSTAKTSTKSGAKSSARAGAKTSTKSGAGSTTKGSAKPATKSSAKPASKTGAKATTKSAAKSTGAKAASVRQ